MRIVKRGTSIYDSRNYYGIIANLGSSTALN